MIQKVVYRRGKNKNDNMGAGSIMPEWVVWLQQWLLSQATETKPNWSCMMIDRSSWSNILYDLKKNKILINKI